MKKSKIFKRVGVIALSAAMAAGVALTAAACGGDGGGTNDRGYRSGTPGRGTDPNKLTVYIFCNDSDASTNRTICNEWMAKYNAAHGTNYTVDFKNETNKQTYFDNLAGYWSANNMYDVMYLAPRYVRTYAETGSVLDLTQYINTVNADPALTGDAAAAANRSVFGQIWKNAASYYSYIRGRAQGTKDTPAYTLGQPVTYKEDQNAFVTDATNEVVGLYGLPKDYSNFSTGYNNLFFADGIKKDITTKKANDDRNVQGAKNGTDGSVADQRTYTADSGNAYDGGAIIRYAASGSYTNPYTNETITVTEGQPAAVINIGIPTAYFPYNFYRYDSYSEALTSGDPLACLCEAYTGGKGYVVTLPGFPNDIVKVPAGTAVDANAPYDTSVGHITYTYGEYAAFIWAMTYYLNTFDWQPAVGKTADGHGGVHIGNEDWVVFGGEQYEGKSGGAVGTVLYLLPWLYGNDADIVNVANALCAARDAEQKVIGEGAALTDPANWRDIAGKATNNVTKMNLDGTIRNVAVQYGFNAERFIETYGAFLALASDWNANNGGDSPNTGTDNGWAYFRAGRSLVYGAGSWDGATRNDTHYDLLEFGQMPNPVSEKYALYSEVKGANYTMETYANGATSKGSGDAAAQDNVQKTDLAAAKNHVYTADEIAANQMLRQDKWGARMDSVGYAVNGQVTNYEGAHAWKEEAAVGLVMALTVDRSSQVSLTYAGAQYPNFRDQMEDFVYYQDKGENGAFKDMITPEGTSDIHYYNADGTVNAAEKAKADEIWKGYYDLALQMETLRVQNSAMTVGDFLNGKQVAGKAVKYDESYKDVQIKDFASSETTTNFTAFGMKILRMIPMTKYNREINIRMQYGLNAVRDSTMYTYNDDWVADLDARNSLDIMLAYVNKYESIALGKTVIDGTNTTSLQSLVNGIKRNPADPAIPGATWSTPLLYCLSTASTCQNKLSNAVKLEANALNKLK